jgi:tartrate dehydrogenase/decarboxylase/D-malate dehydrogenase
MPRQYRVASMPADGVGPEIISAGLEELDTVASRNGGCSLIVRHYDWRSDRYRRHGALTSADAPAWLRTADAICRSWVSGLGE